MGEDMSSNYDRENMRRRMGFKSNDATSSIHAQAWRMEADCGRKEGGLLSVLSHFLPE